MKIPRDLSGAQLVKVLCRDWGYRVVHQEAATSFCKRKNRRTSVCRFPTITPSADTLNSIIRAVSRHKGVERQQLLDTLR